MIRGKGRDQPRRVVTRTASPSRCTIIRKLATLHAADAPDLGELVHERAASDSRMPALVAVSLYFSREERVPH